jgi:hypothetical protein
MKKLAQAIEMILRVVNTPDSTGDDIYFRHKVFIAFSALQIPNSQAFNLKS